MKRTSSGLLCLLEKNWWPISEITDRHGGVIATVMDSVGGVIGAMHFTSIEDKISTIDLRVDYLRGAEPEAIMVEGKIIRFGNRILVARMKAFQNDKLIAEGKGVYNFVRMNNDGDESDDHKSNI